MWCCYLFCKGGGVHLQQAWRELGRFHIAAVSCQVELEACWAPARESRNISAVEHRVCYSLYGGSPHHREPQVRGCWKRLARFGFALVWVMFKELWALLWIRWRR
jgi:hypothetical protein